jgi:hypothetical protein
LCLRTFDDLVLAPFIEHAAGCADAVYRLSAGLRVDDAAALQPRFCIRYDVVALLCTQHWMIARLSRFVVGAVSETKTSQPRQKDSSFPKSHSFAMKIDRQRAG